LFSICYAAAAISTFDNGLEGWFSNTPGEVTWSSMNGNLDGYVSFTDASPNWSYIAAPDSFLGDWSHLDGTGRISYDQKIFSTGSVIAYTPYSIEISGPGGSARWDRESPSGTTEWVHVEALLNEQNWTVNSGSWNDFLSNVDLFLIRIEMVTNSYATEITGIDNVHLTPIPATVWLLCSGLLGLIGLRNRLKK
jgi:hypothetical protein